jgi:hypothetical protein
MLKRMGSVPGESRTDSCVRQPWRRVGILALVGFLLIVGGCSKSSSPTSPAVPSVKQLKIVVTASADTLLIGTIETFRATATAPDGTTTSVTDGVWVSEDSSIATVEASTGRVTIVGNGYVVISVQSQGNSGGIMIRGVPDYQGSWSGSYSFKTCDSSGDFSATNWCNNFPANEVFPANLNLAQNLDAVTGFSRFGRFSANVSGTIRGEGAVTLLGTMTYELNTIDVYCTLQLATPGKITGIMTWNCRSAKMTGESHILAEIRDMNRAQ